MSSDAKRTFNLSPNRRELLKALLREEGVNPSSSRRIARRSDQSPAPLSFAQERLWFLDQFQPASAVYNIPTTMRITTPLQVAALERSLNAIVQRHEILRTTFAVVDNRPVQVVAPALTVALPLRDLRHLPPAAREAEAQRLAAVEAQQPFDLSRGPLLRAVLLRLGPADHVLLLTLHHIVTDAWSMTILFRELGVLYEAFVAGKPAPLPELPIQYADYAHWQRAWLEGTGDWGLGTGDWGLGTGVRDQETTAPVPPPAGGGTEGGGSQESDVGESQTQNSKLKTQNSPIEAQLAYWRRQLADTPAVLDLPTDRPRPPVQTFRGAYHSFELPQELAAGLAALSRQEDVTLFMTLLAAFEALLYRYTGQTDVLVGTPITGRTRVETEGLIGFFLNTLVLRTSLAGDPSFRALLRRVREVTLGAYAHQDLPFEKLVEELQPARNLSHNPLFQVMFVLQNAPPGQANASAVGATAGAAPRAPQAATGTAKFDLLLAMAETGQTMLGVIEYNTDLFDAATIERMAGHWRTLLAGVTAGPDRRLAQLPLLTDAERRTLEGWSIAWTGVRSQESGVRSAWFASGLLAPGSWCVHQLVEAQVARTADAVALVFDTSTPLPPPARGGTDAPLPPLAGGGTDARLPPLAGGGTDARLPPPAGGGTDARLPPPAGGGTDARLPPPAGGGTEGGAAQAPNHTLPQTSTPLPPLAGGGTDARLPPLAGGGTDARLPPPARGGTDARLPPPAGGGTEGGRRWASAALSPQSSVLSPEHLTYDELNRRANQLARYLRSLGVGPEVLVGLCLERSPELLVGLLGVLKAGGAYVPLDPAYPQERLAFMLADARVTVLVTTNDQRPTTNDQRPTTNDRRSRMESRRSSIFHPRSSILDPRSPILDPQSPIPNPQSPITVDLDADWPAIAGERAEDLAVEVAPDNLAYVIYTSGSTGRPKGIAMPHRPLANLIAWQAQSTSLHGEARTMQLASLSFDVSFQEIFSTWCAGGTLVLTGEESRRDAGELARYLTDMTVERLFLPPVMLQRLAETLAGAAAVPASLHEIITAGEQLQITRDIAGLFTRLKGCALRNQYGPTESHVVTEHILAGAANDWPVLSSIGGPIANVRIYLLDPLLQHVPIGVPGELYISGMSLARGYLGRPDLTAERFVPNPFTGVLGDGCWVTEDSDPNTQHPTPNTRLYRTGDLARYQPDGTLAFLGRADQQVKLRGYRIELGEIETVLSQHPAVQEAVAVVREDAPGDRRLVAYVVPKIEDRRLKIEDSNLGSSERLSSIFYPLSSILTELRDFLKQRLPDYMVPSAFVLLETLPLNPNGKVDRRALPAVDRTRRDLEHAFVAPRTPVEELLAGIWTQILGRERIGIHDDFFELGGHSLLATQVIARIYDAFQVELPLRRLFEAPTVAGLALAVVGSQLEQVDSAEMAQILAELEQLSQDDARALL